MWGSEKKKRKKEKGEKEGFEDLTSVQNFSWYLDTKENGLFFLFV